MIHALARLALILALPISAAAEGLPAKLKPSAIVLVENAEGADFCSPRASNSDELELRLNPDGTKSPFVIPPKRVFVVTAVNWTTAGDAGEQALFFLSVLSRTAATTALHIAHTATYTLPTTGTHALTSELPVPVVVSSAAALCAQSFGTAPVGRVVAQGYFAKDR